jgi:hypothetical protein
VEISVDPQIREMMKDKMFRSKDQTHLKKLRGNCLLKVLLKVFGNKLSRLLNSFKAL